MTNGKGSLVLLGLALMAAVAGTAQPFDIAFDGACDGLRLEIGQDLMVGGRHTGCVSGKVIGNIAIDFVAHPFDQQSGVGINIRPQRNARGFPVFSTLLNFQTMEWGLYITVTGEAPSILASGSFSSGTPTAKSAR